MLSNDISQNPQLENIVATVIRSQPVELPVVPEQAEPKLPIVTSYDLDTVEVATEFYIDNFLIRGEPCLVAGEEKCLKTTILVAMAVSLTSGEPFLFHGGRGVRLGGFDVIQRARVGIISGESGRGTLRETGKRIAQSLNLELRDLSDLLWCFDIPDLESSTGLDMVEAFVRDYGLGVLMIDPAYRAFNGEQANNVHIMGRQLGNFCDRCLPHGCTPIMAHHTTKNSSGDGIRTKRRPASLRDASWSGYREFARQWVLLSRRSEYRDDGKHEMWIRAGGSAGHGGIWCLDVEEGRRTRELDRKWEITRLESDHERLDREEQQEKTRNENRLEEDVMDLRKFMLSQFPEGNSKTAIRKSRGWKPDRFDPAYEILLAGGEIQTNIRYKTAGGSTRNDGIKLLVPGITCHDVAHTASAAAG